MGNETWFLFMNQRAPGICSAFSILRMNKTHIYFNYKTSYLLTKREQSLILILQSKNIFFFFLEDFGFLYIKYMHMKIEQNFRAFCFHRNLAEALASNAQCCKLLGEAGFPVLQYNTSFLCISITNWVLKNHPWRLTAVS